MPDSAGFAMVPRYLRGRLTAHEIAAYVALTWRFDESGVCWPSLQTLAEDAGMSVSTMQRALSKLLELGLLEKRAQQRVDGGQSSNVYHLNLTPWSQGLGGVVTGTRGGGHRDQGPLVPVTNEVEPVEVEPVEVDPLNETLPLPLHSTSGATAPQTDRFEEFWTVYDKKRGRKSAEQKWRLALKKRGVTAQLLIEAASEYVAWQKADGKHPTYTKDPATWLNGEHWRDERVSRRLGSQHFEGTTGTYVDDAGQVRW